MSTMLPKPFPLYSLDPARRKDAKPHVDYSFFDTLPKHPEEEE